MYAIPGTEYISNVAGFKDTHYGFGYVSGTMIEGTGKEARLQKQLLKTTRTEEEKLSLALFIQTNKYPELEMYKELVLQLLPGLERKRFANPLALLYGMSVLKFPSYDIDKDKLSTLFKDSGDVVEDDEEKKETEEDDEEKKDEGEVKQKTAVMRKKNGVRDIDVVRYAFLLQKAAVKMGYKTR